MKISVLGCGRWGTFIAWYLNEINHEVILWGRESSVRMKQLINSRRNDFLSLDPAVTLTHNLHNALTKSEVIVISISAQQLRDLLLEIKKSDTNACEKTFVLCMKGMEETTGKRLSEVMKECLGEKTKVAVWVGPGHVQDFMQGIPNCMVIDSDNNETKTILADEFSGSLIRFYYGTDIIGTEIGSAAKNVMGIAAGILDGMGYQSLKGALMSRGTREISKLIKVLGGNESSAYGLAHLGDYQATLFSPHSNNRKFGECLVTGEKCAKLAEGVATSHALLKLGDKLGVELPISRAVYNTIHGKSTAKEAIANLFLRSVKSEF